MRQIFSVRFFAAVGAVAGLLFLLTTVFTARGVIDEAIDDDGADAATVQLRAVDLVDTIASSSNPSFQVSPDGLAAADTQLVLDASRQVHLVAGTPGVDHCGRLAEPGMCAIVADLLGEGVVWFAFVPAGAGRTVALPAVDSLDGGVATLVNGWQFPHAPAFDRRCPAANGDGDEVFESYRQFEQLFGENFTTLYDLDQRRLTAVVCRQMVPYAPPPRATSTTIPVPGPTLDTATTVATT